MQAARFSVQTVGYWLEVIGACALKDALTALTNRIALFQMLILPFNYNMLLILFALAGSAAPTAVVMNDHGFYANRLYDAMERSSSFRLQVVPDAADANSLLTRGEIVAVVTIPANFDALIRVGGTPRVGMLINNLNTDETDDVRRGIDLAVTTFYAQNFPGQVSIVTQLHEQYARETDYIPYLSVSIVVIGLLVGGLLQAGNSVADDYESQRIKEDWLSPAPRWTMVVGKMLGAAAVSLLSAIVVVLFLVLVIRDVPLHWGGLVATILLTSAVCVAAGTVVGNLLRNRQTVTLFTRGSSVPLFFLSGVFNPITYSTVALVVVARLLPIHYAIALMQWSVLDFRTNTLSLAGNALVLLGFLVLFIVIASLLLRRSNVTH